MNGYAARLQEGRIQEFHYRLPWRSQAVYPGYHRGVQPGPGQDFRAYEPLFRHPDARRLDLRVSLRDPFGMPHVRVFNQRSTVPVYAVADLSGSMGSPGDKGKLQLLAEFTAATALSAYRTGDPFGFIGCDTAVRRDLLLAATHRAGATWDVAERLSRLQVGPVGAEGLREASRYVSVRRSLVFLVSDFHLPFAYRRCAGLVLPARCGADRGMGVRGIPATAGHGPRPGAGQGDGRDPDIVVPAAVAPTVPSRIRSA